MTKNIPFTNEDLLSLLTLKELFGGFAHEIAQPLNAITIASQVIRLRMDKSALEAPEKDLLLKRLSVIPDQVQRAIEIIDSLKNYTKTPRVDEPPGTLAGIVEHINALMGRQMIGHGISFSITNDQSNEILIRDSTNIEGILIQAVAYARDLVCECVEKTEATEMGRQPLISMNIGECESQTLVTISWTVEPAGLPGTLEADLDHQGLRAAEALLVSRGGKLNHIKDGLQVAIPL